MDTSPLPGHSSVQKKPHPARHVFSIAGISLFTVFIIASFFIAAVYLKALIAENQLAAVVTATLVDLANGDRKANALGALTVNPVLVKAAQAKADHMAANGYFAHISPDGRDSWSWFRDAGYSFSYAGENLAVNFSDSEDVEEAWMDSPTHRANIMNGRFTEVGIAIAVGEYKGKKTTFVVQMFGRPSIPSAAPAPVSSMPAEPDELAVATTEPEVVREWLPATEAAPAAAAIETDAPPAAPVVVTEDAPREGDVLGFFTASPETLLRAVYLLSALIILISLLLTTELEFKKHHARHVLAALFLLALMGGLFTAADYLVFTKPLVGGAYLAIP